MYYYRNIYRKHGPWNIHGVTIYWRRNYHGDSVPIVTIIDRDSAQLLFYYYGLLIDQKIISPLKVDIPSKSSRACKWWLKSTEKEKENIKLMMKIETNKGEEIWPSSL